MTTEEPIPSIHDVRSNLSTWVGVVLLFAFFALLVWAILGVTPRGDRYEQKRAEARSEKLKTAQTEWTKNLENYAWIDKAKGTARIPISRAMELTVADLHGKKPTAANPIPAPAALAESPVTKAGAAAPSATPAAPPAGPTASPKATSILGQNSMNRGQPTSAANPPSAPPGTQPGPSNTPAASPGAPSTQPHPGGTPLPTPVQSAPGNPLPVPGKTP